jgi:hypothetical protein
MCCSHGIAQSAHFRQVAGNRVQQGRIGLEEVGSQVVILRSCLGSCVASGGSSFQTSGLWTAYPQSKYYCPHPSSAVRTVN